MLQTLVFAGFKYTKNLLNKINMTEIIQNNKYILYQRNSLMYQNKYANNLNYFLQGLENHRKLMQMLSSKTEKSKNDFNGLFLYLLEVFAV